METQAATDDIAPEIPQPVAIETVIQEAVTTSTVNLQPKPQNPHSKKQKFKADDFFAEHIFFTDYNPYDSARLRRKRFRTASQMNFYSSLLFDKDKIFDHEQIPHVVMESLPCITPIHHCSHLCNRFLSPLCRLKRFTWALKNIELLFSLFLKKFQPLVLMYMLLKKWRSRLLVMTLLLKFLTLWLQRL